MNDAPHQSWDERDLVELLTLENLSPWRFRSRHGQMNENKRAYGGQIMGQALTAAAQTVPGGRAPTMLQFLFLQGALADQPIEFDVTALQDGKRFCSRHVRGAQEGGRIVCDAQVTFSAPVVGPSHSSPPPEDLVETDPETLPKLTHVSGSLAGDVERVLGYRFAEFDFLDLRLQEPSDIAISLTPEPRLRYWIKLRQKLSGDPHLQAAAFAYVSDWWINFASCGGHVQPMIDAARRLYVASLNHAIWFHRTVRADEWMFFDCVSPSAGDGRGLTIASVYDRAGRLVASATQECLIATFDE